MELLNQARRNQSFEEKNQLHESERILIAQVNSNDNEQRLYDSQKHMMNLDYERFLKDSLAKMGGEKRANELEKIKSFTPNYPF